MVPWWTLLIMVGVLFVAVAALEAYHAEERREWMDRLMSRDLTEYKSFAASYKPPKGGNAVLRSMERARRLMSAEYQDEES